jgi:hypothetical protein
MQRAEFARNSLGGAPKLLPSADKLARQAVDLRGCEIAMRSLGAGPNEMPTMPLAESPCCADILKTNAAWRSRRSALWSHKFRL